MRILRFLAALWEHVRWIRRYASLDEVMLRAKICSECKERGDDDICSVCGCVIPIKITWADQSCPLGKWCKAHVFNDCDTGHEKKEAT